MSKFDYKVYTYNNRAISNDDETLTTNLQHFGDLGWELVSAVPVVRGDGSDGDMNIRTDEIKFILKKVKY
ncbi:hypothetical protein [Ectobacillus funiculus]|uniref:hypothetical protein n=1 Tax=Ectobacillus funiculus TaxID=137993 RepID=UPI00101C742B|nr:hypothetical protein [Ectobacillus funiculus]